MNERIKELMEQAKRPLGELRPKMANTGAKWDMVLDPEKFAELIVKECSSICQNVGDTLWAEQYQSNIGTARTCEAAIREHFGVEE